MKFLIDANLPRKLALSLSTLGYDVIHTEDMPNKEKTKDSEILATALYEDRVVVSKDTDFLNSYMVKKVPKKLLLISTGNISNRGLMKLFEDNLNTIVKYFENYDLIELNNIEIIVHD